MMACALTCIYARHGLVLARLNGPLTLVQYGRPTKTSPEKPLCSSGACPARNHSNLAAFVQWTATHFPHSVYGWELGNELNSCLDGTAGARTQADDFKALRALVSEIYAKSSATPPLLIGPDTHSNTEFKPDGLEWFKSFADEAASAVDILTFHMCGMHAQLTTNGLASHNGLINDGEHAEGRSGHDALTGCIE